MSDGGGNPIDPTVHCSSCAAVCCRLQVVVMPEDDVPEQFVDRRTPGLSLLGKDDDGWCIALDRAEMACSIYELRPRTCRKFAMGGAYCRDERRLFADGLRRTPPLPPEEPLPLRVTRRARRR